MITSWSQDRNVLENRDSNKSRLPEIELTVKDMEFGTLAPYVCACRTTHKGLVSEDPQTLKLES